MEYLDIKVEKHSWYISDTLLVTEEPVSTEEKRRQVEHNRALYRMILAGPFATYEDATEMSKDLNKKVNIWQAKTASVE